MTDVRISGGDATLLLRVVILQIIIITFNLNLKRAIVLSCQAIFNVNAVQHQTSLFMWRLFEDFESKCL